MTPVKKTNPIRILIADDHPIVCEGLAALINRRKDMTVVAEARNGQEAVDLFQQHHPVQNFLQLLLPADDEVLAHSNQLHENIIHAPRSFCRRDFCACG